MPDSTWSEPGAAVDRHLLKAAMRRAGSRQLSHVTRLARAVRRSGPGRLPGEVLSVEERGDELVVGGWASLPGLPISWVLVAVDGRIVGGAAPVDPTPELPWVGPVTPRSAFAGWTVVVPTAAMASTDLTQPFTITALAVLDRGFVEPLIPLTVTLPPKPPLPIGVLDVPADGAIIERRSLYVRGWLSPTAGLDRVEVAVAGGEPVRARLSATPRPDVVAATEDPLDMMSGWEALIELPGDLPPGTSVEVRACARSRAREVLLGRVEVVVKPTSQSDVLPPGEEPVLDLGRFDRLEHTSSGHGLRLVVFTHDLGLGGGQLYLQDLLRGLLSAGDVACLVVSQADGPLRQELERLGAVVHLTGPYPLEPFAYESRLRELTALCREVDPDAVLANTAGTFIGVDLAQRMGVPAVWAIHESFTLDGFFVAAYGAGRHDYVRSRAAAALDSAAAVIFEADATRRLFEEHGDPRRFLKLDYGIPLAEIDAFRATHSRDAVRSNLGFNPDDVVMVCLGTYEPRKAQVSLLFAFGRLASEFPDASLVLVGDIGTPYSAGVHQIAQALDLGGRVRLLGVTDDTYSWYHAADVLVSASDIESLPRSVLEAMAFEVPVVAAEVFGLPELITDGADGLLFEPSDVAAITDALQRVLAMESDRRSAIGRAGGDLVRRTRDEKTFAAAYRKLFDALLGDSRALPAEWLVHGEATSGDNFLT